MDACQALCLSPKKNIPKETLWMLSNIAAGTPGQAARLIQHTTLIDTVFEILRKGVAFDVMPLNQTCL